LRVLITGADGFVGGQLVTYLLAETDWDLTGTLHPQSVQGATKKRRLRLDQIDLCDPDSVDALFDWARPDYVFHLAAQSSVSLSFEDPWGTLENNVRAELNVLEATRYARRESVVLVVGSSEEYGVPGPGELPQTEESPLRPGTPYAVSKLAQDFLGLQYFLAHGMPVVRVRPFNHTGPGQSPRFVVPAFAQQIAAIEFGLQEPVIKVGNLDAIRDFSDVRDIVRGYYLAVTQAVPGEVYNLASGQPRTVRGVLETLLGLSQAEIRVEPDPARLRPLDIPAVYGSAEKFRRQTGWEPEISFEQTLRDTLGYWRAQTCRLPGARTDSG
jgi:GDP-4-dehydro-6-deoxy-D-mannose reductase